MTPNLSEIQQSFDRLADGVSRAEEIEAVRIQYLGRKGLIAELFKKMGDLSADERREMGVGLNRLKAHCEDRLKQAHTRLGGASGDPIGAHSIDVILPGVPAPI